MNQPAYLIEKKTILMTGEYDRFGKLCARIVAGGASFLVDRTPLQLLDASLTYIGFNLKGATIGAKAILGKKNKCPIIANPYQNICLFPTKSPLKEDCIWFNIEHIVQTKAVGGKTEVELSNGHSIIVNAKLSALNNKIQTAGQLKRISLERGQYTGHYKPQKGHQLVIEKTGKYNFGVIKEDQI